VFGLLTVLSTQVGSCLISDDEIAAILFYRLKKKENLVQPMLQGDKLVPDASPLPASRDDGFSRWKALLIWVVCAGLVYWIAGLG
jgi:hypothetical protein